MTVGVADEHSDGGAGNFTRRVMQNWAHRLHRFGSPSHAAAVLEHVPIDMRTTAEADFLRVLEIVRFGALARASADAVAAASAIEPGSAADLKAVADAKAAGAPAEGTRRIGGGNASRVGWLLAGSVLRVPVVGALRVVGTKMVAAKLFGSHLLGAALVAVCALAEMDFEYFNPPDPKAPRPCGARLDPTPSGTAARSLPSCPPCCTAC